MVNKGEHNRRDTWPPTLVFIKGEIILRTIRTFLFMRLGGGAVLMMMMMTTIDNDDYTPKQT